MIELGRTELKAFYFYYFLPLVLYVTGSLKLSEIVSLSVKG